MGRRSKRGGAQTAVAAAVPVSRAITDSGSLTEWRKTISKHLHSVVLLRAGDAGSGGIAASAAVVVAAVGHSIFPRELTNLMVEYLYPSFQQMISCPKWINTLMLSRAGYWLGWSLVPSSDAARGAGIDHSAGPVLQAHALAERFRDIMINGRRQPFVDPLQDDATTEQLLRACGVLNELHDCEKYDTDGLVLTVRTKLGRASAPIDRYAYKLDERLEQHQFWLHTAGGAGAGAASGTATTAAATVSHAPALYLCVRRYVSRAADGSVLLTHAKRETIRIAFDAAFGPLSASHKQ